METQALRPVPRHESAVCPPSRRTLLDVERHGDDSRLRIQGAFDALGIRDIGPVIEGLLQSGPSRVTVDLGRVSLMDSSGVSAIVSLRKRMSAQGGQVVVVHARAQPLSILKVLRLEALLGM